jgi:hypothetical protein
VKSLSKTALAVAGGVALAATAALAPSAASAAPTSESGSSSVACQWVYQYRVTAFGDMTDAEWGGNRIGEAYIDDTFNVRYMGNPRYWGANVDNGRWGWILASKLAYTGNTWCA